MNQKKQTFALDVRVLMCTHCGAPISAPPTGGQVRCEYCDTVAQVAPRPEMAPAEPAPQPTPQVDAAALEQRRIAVLHRQARSYDTANNPYAYYHAPPGLEGFQRRLISKGTRDAAFAREAQAEFNQAVAQCVASPGDPAAQRRCYWLARAMGQIWVAQDEFLWQRAVLETASEVLTDHGHQYIMRCLLSKAARALGDLASADAWLAQCEPDPVLLDLDTAYRIAAASNALARDDYGKALSLMGSAEGEFPFEPSSLLLSNIIRAAAFEGIGNRAAAEGALKTVIHRNGRTDAARVLEVNDAVHKARETWDRLKARDEIPAARKSGGGRGCFTVLFMLLVVAALAVAPVVFSPFICSGMTSCTGFHQPALQRLQACPAAVQALGSPVEASNVGLSYGNFETSGPVGSASWRMPVHGSRASGIYEFDASKSMGVWTITSGRVTVEGRTIDLTMCTMSTQPGFPAAVPVLPGGSPTPVLPTQLGQCDRMAACCQAGAGNPAVSAVCQNLPTYRSMQHGEMACQAAMQGLGRISGLPAQCR